MYARRIGDRELTFDFADGLIKDNLLIVDRETNSVWSQLHGSAVIGPMRGTPLQMIPTLQATWGFWRARHPDTRVAVLPGDGRRYHYRNRTPGQTSPRRRPAGHDTSKVGLALAVGGDAVFFPFRELQKTTTPFAMQVGGERVRIHYSADGLTAWAEDERGTLLPGVIAYQDGWLEFVPRSRIYKARRQR